MKWQNVEPEIQILSASAIFGNMHLVDVIKILYALNRVPTIITSKDCIQKIEDHIRSSDNEMGGIIIGKIYHLPFQPHHKYKYITFFTNIVPSTNFRNSRVSLRMDSEIWDKVESFIKEKKCVIGWYHSHPNIGAFFSGTDRMTQQAVFNYPYALGMVIDPINYDIKYFWGPQSEEITINIQFISETFLNRL